MKVTDKNFVDPNQSLEKAKGATKKHSLEKATAEHQPPVADSEELSSAKVKLSDRANQMKKIRDHIASTPDVDEAKVLKYKSMLAKGDYKVDSKAVADRMVDEHLKNDFFINPHKED